MLIVLLTVLVTFLTRETESVISEVLVLPGLSDHSAVSCDIILQKPEPVKKVIVTRKWKSFHNSLLESRLHEILSEIDVEEVSIEEPINLYESSLTELFDELCPLKARTITLRENSPWYNDDIRAAKQLRRFFFIFFLYIMQKQTIANSGVPV